MLQLSSYPYSLVLINLSTYPTGLPQLLVSMKSSFIHLFVYSLIKSESTTYLIYKIQVPTWFVVQQRQKSSSFSFHTVPDSESMREATAIRASLLCKWFHLESGECGSMSRSEMKPRNLHVCQVFRSCWCNQSREHRELPTQTLKLLLLLLNKNLSTALPSCFSALSSACPFSLCKCP